MGISRLRRPGASAAASRHEHRPAVIIHVRALPRPEAGGDAVRTRDDRLNTLFSHYLGCHRVADQRHVDAPLHQNRNGKARCVFHRVVRAALDRRVVHDHAADQQRNEQRRDRRGHFPAGALGRFIDTFEAYRAAYSHPDWQVVTGTPPDGPWCKALAVADALRRADGSMLVLADADVWTDGVGLAVEAVRRGAPWAIPHGLVYRLDGIATTKVLVGTSPSPSVGGLARQPYRGIEGGGITVLTRDLYEQIPLDRRYVGWGQEDESHGLALSTIAGRRWRGVAPLWHLYHEPMPRLNAHVGSAESRALHVRYQYAAQDGPVAMRALLAEIQPAPVEA